jgi:hypothetical protein
MNYIDHGRIKMKTSKEIFKEVWIEWFGDSNVFDEQLNIALDHDYIFQAMERYAKQEMFNELSNVMSFSYSKKYVQDRLEELKLQNGGKENEKVE